MNWSKQQVTEAAVLSRLHLDQIFTSRRVADDMLTPCGYAVRFPHLQPCRPVTGYSFSAASMGLCAITKRVGEECSPASDPPPITGCPSCLLRMFYKDGEEVRLVDRMEEGEFEWANGGGRVRCVQNGGSQVGGGGMSMSLSGFTAHSPSS